jgi:hypothetical protein
MWYEIIEAYSLTDDSLTEVSSYGEKKVAESAIGTTVWIFFIENFRDLWLRSGKHVRNHSIGAYICGNNTTEMSRYITILHSNINTEPCHNTALKLLLFTQ